MNAIFYDQPDEDYRKSEGFNASGIKKFMRSAAHWKADQDEPKESTPALAVGILFHHLLLTPTAPLRVVIKPDDFDGRTAIGKAWNAANAGKAVVTADQAKNCERMVESIRKHKNAAMAFGQGKPEVSVFHEYKNPYTGVVTQLKGRMDFINDGTAIVDAKSCEDARPASFSTSAVDFGYFWQACFYLEFLWNPVCDKLGKPEQKKTDFCFVAVEKTPPYAVKCYAVSPGAIEFYKPRIEEEITKFEMAKASGFYPSYPEDIALLTPPEWGVRKEVINQMKLEATR